MRRAYYVCPDCSGQTLFPPLDRKLKLRSDHWSEGAAKVAARQGLQTRSFALAAEGYSEAVGGAISDESVRLITDGWGAACEAKRAAEEAVVNAAAQRGERPGESRLTPIDPIQQQAHVSSDGAKLLIRGEGWKEVKMGGFRFLHPLIQLSADVRMRSRPYTFQQELSERGHIRLKACYEIVVRGHLGDDWADWFDGLTLTALPNGETRLSGIVADQAALLGILWRINNLGVVLLSVTKIQP